MLVKKEASTGENCLRRVALFLRGDRTLLAPCSGRPALRQVELPLRKPHCRPEPAHWAWTCGLDSTTFQCWPVPTVPVPCQTYHSTFFFFNAPSIRSRLYRFLSQPGRSCRRVLSPFQETLGMRCQVKEVGGGRQYLWSFVISCHLLNCRRTEHLVWGLKSLLFSVF